MHHFAPELKNIALWREMLSLRVVCYIRIQMPKSTDTILVQMEISTGTSHHPFVTGTVHILNTTGTERNDRRDSFWKSRRDVERHSRAPHQSEHTTHIRSTAIPQITESPNEKAYDIRRRRVAHARISNYCRMPIFNIQHKALRAPAICSLDGFPDYLDMPRVMLKKQVFAAERGYILWYTIGSITEQITTVQLYNTAFWQRKSPYAKDVGQEKRLCSNHQYIKMSPGHIDCRLYCRIIMGWT